MTTVKKYSALPGLLFYDCEQGSREWLTERCRSVGSSEVSSAFAGGKGRSRRALMDRKIRELYTGEPEEIFRSAAMERGCRLESDAAGWFEKATGLDTLQIGLVRNEDYPGFHASPDRLIDHGSTLTGLEIKCPQKKTHLKYLSEWRVPPEYRRQVDIQMMICRAEYWFFLSWHSEYGRMLLKINAPSAAKQAGYRIEMERWNMNFSARLGMAEQIVAERNAEVLRAEEEEALLVDAARIRTEHLIGEIR